MGMDEMRDLKRLVGFTMDVHIERTPANLFSNLKTAFCYGILDNHSILDRMSQRVM